MDTSFSAPRTPSPLSDLTLPGMCTETYFHTYTHLCTDIHLGLMPLFQHWGSMTFCALRTAPVCHLHPKLSNLILSCLALLSRQGSFLEAVAEFTP